MSERKKNILVTGVSRGVGLEVCKILAKKTYNIFGISRTTTEEFRSIKDEYPQQIHWASFDLNDTEKIQLIFKDFIGLKNQLHGIVNNAAVAYDDLVTNIDLDRLVYMFKVNVFSSMIITKYAIRHMILHGISGSIVHVSSISAHTGYKGLAMYASSKAAIEAFSRSVAREWGAKGIRSNVVAPGFMETDMSRSLSQEQKNSIYRRTALKKAVDISSVAYTIEFLLSEKAASITGQSILVDSGTI